VEQGFYGSDVFPAAQPSVLKQRRNPNPNLDRRGIAPFTPAFQQCAMNYLFMTMALTTMNIIIISSSTTPTMIPIIAPVSINSHQHQR